MPVPLCDIKAQYRPLRDELLDAVTRVLDSGQVVLGPEVASLEEEVARYCGSRFAVGCASGSDALLLALAALDIGPGDEVILPTFTFFATAGAVARLGATPVFADIDPVTFNIDPTDVESKVTSRTKAIMPVHLYGRCADMGLLSEIAESYDVPLIEDAAQAFGATYNGLKAGSVGRFGCMSFYPSKNLAAYGDAGLVVTDDHTMCEKMKALRVHGMSPKYYHKFVGWNGRIDPIQASMLRVKLPHIDAWIDGRREAARRYDELILSAGLDAHMARPRAADGHSFNQYVVRVPGGRRDSAVDLLKSRGVGCEVYYPVPLHMQECFADLEYKPGDFPVSERAAEEVLALPMFPEITGGQQLEVVNALATALRKPARLAA